MRKFGIRSRLLALLALPTLVLIAVAAFGVVRSTRLVDDAERVTRLVEHIALTTDVIDDLQAERLASVLYVRSNRTQGEGALTVARSRTNNSAALMLEDTTALESALDLSGVKDEALYPDGERLGGIDAHRELILGDNATGLTQDAVTSYYDRAIEDLIVIGETLGLAVDNEALGDEVRNLSIFERLVEQSAREGMVMSAVLADGAMSDEQRVQLALAEAGQDSYRETYNLTASPSARRLLEQKLDTPTIRRLDTVRRLAIGLHNVGSPIVFDTVSYELGMSGKLKEMRLVGQQLRENLLANAAQVEAGAARNQVLYLVAAVVAVLVALLLTLVMTRSLVRPLRKLDGAARRLRERLPAAVEQLQRPDADIDPTDITRPPAIRSAPELMRLADALGEVGSVAVRVATDQARLRASVAHMFTNFARRNQRLLDRQLVLIDTLEAEESDADRLGELFSLDHLATRMRRNAESLLVLAGDESRSTSSQPVNVTDVIRAATSEIEEFERVQISTEQSVDIAGRVVSSLSHLLAELLENATSFSPPERPVEVHVHAPDQTGLRVSITDHGIGMSDDELARANERIANPPMIDAAASQLLGLYVVGRLAKRLGVTVRLHGNRAAGVRADVLIPNDLLATGDDSHADEADEADEDSIAVVPQAQEPAGGGGPVRPPASTHRTASGLAKRASSQPEIEQPGADDAPAAPATPATVEEQEPAPSVFSQFAQARLEAEGSEGSEASRSKPEPAQQPAGPAEPAQDEVHSAVGSPMADLDRPTEEVQPKEASSAQASGGRLPGRIPKHVQTMETAQSNGSPLKPLSPDSVASTLASLQSAWRQVNDAGHHESDSAHASASVVAAAEPKAAPDRVAPAHVEQDEPVQAGTESTEPQSVPRRTKRRARSSVNTHAWSTPWNETRQ